MSKPRQVLPKATYLITRRTILRHMLFRPDREMNQILIYLLAVSAKRFGLEVHALCAMSTHLHLVVTDVKGKLPPFLQFFHRMVALCTKEHRQWDGPVWDKSPTSAVRLETPAAVVQEIAYVIANPVAAGLVQHAHEWPGAKVRVDELGEGELWASRPEVYLNPKNRRWPAEATLRITLPPTVEAAEAKTFQKQVEAEVDRLEAQAHAEMAERRRPFLGAARARNVSPTARATTAEPKFNYNPVFAVGRGQGDAWRDADAKWTAFQNSYQAALARWRAGVRGVVFPAGTWLMHVFHRAAAHAPLRA